MRSAVIVIGGAPPPLAVVDVLPVDAFVIAADSGYDHAMTLGLTVDLLVGDLDSISPEGLRHAEVEGGPVIERFPVAKDATDTELAMHAALARGYDHLVVVAGGGDRIDHVLATLFAAASAEFAAARVELWWGPASIEVRHAGPGRPVDVTSGAVFSVLPVHGDATGVQISGAAYPLVDHTLRAGTSLGVSNVGTDADAPTVIAVGTGTVLVIRPNVLGGQP